MASSTPDAYAWYPNVILSSILQTRSFPVLHIEFIGEKPNSERYFTVADGVEDVWDTSEEKDSRADMGRNRQEPRHPAGNRPA